MNFTIALFVSLLCGLIWAQETVHESVSHPCSAGWDLQKDFIAMKDKLAEIETKLDKERYIVAFSAVTGGGNRPLGPYDRNTTLIYRTVITNIGNFYNQATGIFTAPVSGLYHFTLFYHSGGAYRAALSLLKNEALIVGTSDHKSVDTADNGGNAVYLQLQQGDQVFVRLEAGTFVWGNDELTTFSGLLVSQD